MATLEELEAEVKRLRDEVSEMKSAFVQMVLAQALAELREDEGIEFYIEGDETVN